MTSQKIISDWKNKIYKPLYWLEGEEEYEIDQVIHYAEKNILNADEASFNQKTFYGKDAYWTEIINTCRSYPMFSERQVVLLKEAQQMKNIEKLEAYVIKPLPSTILVIAYKGKTIDGRSKLSKLLKQHGEILSTKKIYDNQLPGWTSEFIKSKGYEISSRALMMLVDHIGNDLSRIANEVEKVLVNLEKRKEIAEDDIERFVGISKEFNIFELQEALSNKDLSKAIRIIQYFGGNPKAAPIQMLLPAIYNHFSKVMSIFQMSDKSEKALRQLFYNNSFATKQALETMMNYSYDGVEKVLMLLHEYNLKSIGINNPGVSDVSLMKEMSVKIISYTG